MKMLQGFWILALTGVFLISCSNVNDGGVALEDRFVDEDMAVRSAVRWMESHFPGKSPFEPSAVQAVAVYGEVNSYNVEFKGGGFAIVSADRNAKPILAFSDSDPLVGGSAKAEKFIEGFSKSTAEAEVDSSALQFHKNLWNALTESSSGPRLFARSATMVEPLIETKWGQSGGYEPNYTYNNAAPYVTNDSYPHDSIRAPVGCAAVAFGQVLKYYNYPKRGQLTHSYCKDGSHYYGCEEIEVDFNTAYDWDAMPNALGYSSSQKSVDAVSSLLYHVGASLDMVYGYHGSGAKIANDSVFKGFRKHFRMSDIEVVKRADYESNEDEWYDLVTDEIKAGRPVILSGTQENVGGHAYIIDGLQENTGYVHVNWGWGGAANGYYDLSTLIIDGKYSFTEDLIAFINITPNLVGPGGSCNGEGGLRCRDGLVCALNDDINQPIDEFSSDETGTCLDINPSGDDVEEGSENEEENLDGELESPGDEDAGDATDADEDIDQGDDDGVMQGVVEKGTIDKGDWMYFGPFFATAGVDVQLRGTGEGDTGDADLYVRRDRKPNQYAYHCRPGKWGSDETCVLSGEGNYFVAVYGYNEVSEFTLTIKDTAE